MTIIRPLAIRAATLILVLFAVLALLVITLGATGYSDRLLSSVVNEDVRAIRQGLSQTIRDPDVLEQTVAIRRQELEKFYGLDKSWQQRLPSAVWRVMRLDLGDARTLKSSSGSNRVSDIIKDRLPNTLLLLTTSLIITAGIGLLVGPRLATRVGSKVDRAVSYLSAVSFAMPTWWIGILLILVFGFKLQLLPSGGMYSTPPPADGIPRFLDLAKHAVLPVLTLVLVSVGPYIYSIRTLTMSIAQEDHVMLARAKGLPDKIVERRHILRVAAPPILTGLILGLAGSIGGAILVETIFNWQGMGRLYFDAVSGQPDESVIVALTFVFTLIYVIARFVLEVLYVFLDPRVRYT